MSKLEDEFKLADRGINNVLKRYKYNSDDWNGVGLIEARDAIAAAGEIRKIVRRTLYIITSDYNVKITFERPVANYIDKIKMVVTDELYHVGIFPHEVGTFLDKYGNEHHQTVDSEYRNFQAEIAKEIDAIDLQLLRFKNFRKRKTLERRLRWLPIIISVLSLTVSIVSLIKSFSNNQ